jgi:hypothetical protein
MRGFWPRVSAYKIVRDLALLARHQSGLAVAVPRRYAIRAGVDELFCKVLVSSRRSPAAFRRGGGVGADALLRRNVEAFHNDARLLAASVGLPQVGSDLALLAGQQGDVAVAVHRR